LSSMRVHELAKELGLETRELIDRIQKSGLGVKPSPLASLDPGLVEQIRGLVHGAPAGPEPAAKPKPTPPALSETTAIPSQVQAPSAPARKSAVEPSLSSSPSPAHTPSAATAAAHVAPAAPPAAPVATPPPVAATSSSPPTTASSRPPLTGGGAPMSSRPPAGTPGPLASHRPGGGLHAPPRGGGPLSGHTPHRAAGSAPSAPAAPQRPAPPSEAGPRPNPTTPPPLRRSDYISPTGTRVSSPNVNARPPMPTGGPPPLRRSGSDAGDSGPRGAGPPPRSSGGGSRPLPSVAAPTGSAPAPRRPDAPRAVGGEAKAQRPEMKLTMEQYRAMRQSGQLGTAAPGAPTRPGAPPSQPGRGPAPPSASPGMRRPPAAGGPAPPAPGFAPPPPPVDDEDERAKGKGNSSRLGTPGDRASRRARRNERANERKSITSPVPAAALIDADDSEGGRRSRSGPRRHKSQGRRGSVAVQQRKSHAELEWPITVRTLSEAIGVPAKDLIRKLMGEDFLGQLVTINANIDDEMAQVLAMEFGVEIEVVYEHTAEDDLEATYAEREASGEGLELRPPVITILGHVDHGKTSLLDRIRKSNVVAGESGGITQHIGAYQVEHDGKKIAFVDTPGHEAFTAMRARGANVTDIVVLVVAADDGVMPQTKEAISHAKAAEVPVVVALNKIDLPGADTSSNINKIYGELSQEGLIPEEYGGDTPVVKTSTVTGQGLDDLLATLEALAELHELKANPNRDASGTCLESSKEEGRGVLATVLVQDGTLHVGDVMVCGDGYGRVRALYDDRGRAVQSAGPSTPVAISGLDEVPSAGEKFAVLNDISVARQIAETRRDRTRGASLGERKVITLENIFDTITEKKAKSLNLILKADVQGSLEALTKELEKLENPEVPIRILHKGVGGIGESDVILADASQAIIIGFRVAPEDRATTLAEEKNIEIRRYDIIYQVTDEVKKAVEGMLVPEIKEVQLGRAVVRQTFKISKVGTVAGCFVTQGTIERSSKARVFRDGREIYKSGIDALKRFKDDVKEVREGFECGIKISNFDDLKVDDVIEAYRIDVIRRTLPTT
jgi:translation initiation factor IF-2